MRGKIKVTSKNKHIFRKDLQSNFLYSKFINPFPRIHEIEKLQVNSKLKPIKIISLKKNHSPKKLFIKFILQISNSSADVYLFLNGNKSDMFYSISSGEYSFNNIELITGKNLIEMYYVHNGLKSKSTFLTLNL